MAWIESHQQLERHPKTYALMGLMGWDLDTTIGKLHRFWWWCLDFAPTGDLRGKNDGVLAGSVGLAAEDGRRFVDAMVQSGWIDRANGVFRIHDWLDYAGKFLGNSKYRRDPQKWASVQALYQVSADSQPTVGGMSTVPTNQPNQPTNPSADGGGGNGEVADVRSELVAAGVNSSARIEQCTAVRGVTPVAVALMAEEYRAKKNGSRIDDVGAVLSARILDNYEPPPLVDPKALCRLARKGRVRSVCGHDVRGKPLSHSSTRLVWEVDGKTASVPITELRPENIQLYRGQREPTT